jgi:hypothetical protein
LQLQISQEPLLMYLSELCPAFFRCRFTSTYTATIA